MVSIRIGGVPEHFNIIWHWAMEKGLFREKQISIDWTDFPGGTGAMNRAMRENELDLAIVLTEGAVTDIINGNPSRILSWFVCSPLIWGVYTNQKSPISSSKEIENKKFAISRKGSGSHLMAFVYANQSGFNAEDKQFVTVGGLDGALNAISNNEADLFLWEKFTTKSYVDSGILKKIDECPTPWPCFVILIREEFYKSNKMVVETLLSVIFKASEDFKALPEAPKLLAEKYALQLRDAKFWLENVIWANHIHMDESEIHKVQATLLGLGIVHTTLDYEEIIINS